MLLVVKICAVFDFFLFPCFHNIDLGRRGDLKSLPLIFWKLPYLSHYIFWLTVAIPKFLKHLGKSFAWILFCKPASLLINFTVRICSFISIRSGSRTAATSKMEHFVIIVNGWKPLTIITESSILDVAAVLDPPLSIIKYFGLNVFQKDLK